MISYVSGHTHANRVDFFKGKKGRGFWEINTASHIDWPEQSRTIEVMDNKDGTLSLFGTLLDSAAPAAAPAPGTSALTMTAGPARLARPHAVLQRPAARGAGGLGRRRGEARPPGGPQRGAAGEGPAR